MKISNLRHARLHVRRLPEEAPGRMALRLAVDTRARGRPDNNPHWKRRPGRSRHIWVRQVEIDTGISADVAWDIAVDRCSCIGRYDPSWSSETDDAACLHIDPALLTSCCPHFFSCDLCSGCSASVEAFFLCGLVVSATVRVATVATLGWPLWPPAKTGKSRKVRQFDTGQGKVREIRKSQGNCGLPVMCLHL